MRNNIETAQEIGDQRFWMPMSLDFRGRVYGLPTFNFYGDDHLRALFLFAEGEPIGHEGLYWLRVHTANCGDFKREDDTKISKKPFDDRVAWVDENIERIRRTVAAPMDEKSRSWWTAASDPFQFLAACFELVAAVEAVETGRSFETHLPVSFDGSCSGIQHLCAMTRAPEGILVNLATNKKPADIYQTIADKVNEKLRAIVAAGEVSPEDLFFARLLRAQHLDRKVVKQNVMTFPYGVTTQGMCDQLMETLMEPLTKQHRSGNHPFGDKTSQKKAARFLAEQVEKVVPEIVGLPAEAMEFLKNLAGVVAQQQQHLRWTTPTGFPWRNQYQEKTDVQVRIYVHEQGPEGSEGPDGRPYTVHIYGRSNAVDKKKARSGVAPNFVHACDAAHLMMTVNAAASDGITNIVTVHDSFGCLASQAERFPRIIREQFVRMYEEHDVLAEILERAKQDLGKKPPKGWPQLPERGTLDLQGVLEAEYAFA